MVYTLACPGNSASTYINASIVEVLKHWLWAFPSQMFPHNTTAQQMCQLSTHNSHQRSLSLFLCHTSQPTSLSQLHTRMLQLNFATTWLEWHHIKCWSTVTVSYHDAPSSRSSNSWFHLFHWSKSVVEVILLQTKSGDRPLSHISKHLSHNEVTKRHRWCDISHWV